MVFLPFTPHPLSGDYMQGIIGPLHSFGIVMPLAAHSSCCIMPQVLKRGWPMSFPQVFSEPCCLPLASSTTSGS